MASNLWVAVGSGGNTIATSSVAGTSWTGRSGPFTYGYGVAYGRDTSGNNLWVVVGYQGYCARSTDTTTWTSSGQIPGMYASAYAVAYGLDTSQEINLYSGIILFVLVFLNCIVSFI